MELDIAALSEAAPVSVVALTVLIAVYGFVKKNPFGALVQVIRELSTSLNNTIEDSAKEREIFAKVIEQERKIFASAIEQSVNTSKESVNISKESAVLHATALHSITEVLDSIKSDMAYVKAGTVKISNIEDSMTSMKKGQSEIADLLRQLVSQLDSAETTLSGVSSIVSQLKTSHDIHDESAKQNAERIANGVEGLQASIESLQSVIQTVLAPKSTEE